MKVPKTKDENKISLTRAVLRDDDEVRAEAALRCTHESLRFRAGRVSGDDNLFGAFTSIGKNE